MCEYDGMVFKQPREEPVPEPRTENMPQNSQARRRGPAAGEEACQRGSSGTPGSAAAAAAAASPGQRGSGGASLEALAAGWFEAEAAAAGADAAVAAALRDICARFCAGGPSLDELAARAAPAPPSPSPSAAGAAAAGAAVNEEVEQADFQVDLEARKAGLRARLEGYEKVGARLRP